MLGECRCDLVEVCTVTALTMIPAQCSQCRARDPRIAESGPCGNLHYFGAGFEKLKIGMGVIVTTGTGHRAPLGCLFEICSAAVCLPNSKPVCQPHNNVAATMPAAHAGNAVAGTTSAPSQVTAAVCPDCFKRFDIDMNKIRKAGDKWEAKELIKPPCGDRLKAGRMLSRWPN